MHDMHAFVCIKGYFVLAGPKKCKVVSFEILKKQVQNQFPFGFVNFCNFAIFEDRGRTLYILKYPANTLLYFPQDV